MDVTTQALTDLEARLNAKIDHILELLKVVITMDEQAIVKSDGIGTSAGSDPIEVRGPVVINSPPEVADANGVIQPPPAALDVRGAIKIQDASTFEGDLSIGGNTKIGGLECNSLTIQTKTGLMTIGSGNESWAHFSTDRGKYYFDKEIRVNSGKIGSYNEDLHLCIKGASQVTINEAGDMHVTGSLKVGAVNIVERIEALEQANSKRKSEIAQLRTDIKEGKVIAKKAQWLQARDKHWMRWNHTNVKNFDMFYLYSEPDDKWHGLIGLAR